MNKNLLPIAAAVMLALGGCGGGGGSSSSSTGGGSGGSTNGDGEVLSSIVSGIEIPTEISAVPASSANGSGKAINKMVSFSGAIRALATSVSELSADSDYAKAVPSVYVEERALEQFDIIETVFSALEQTHYADQDNVNQGPYKAMIAWEDEQNGKDIKQMQTWTVESRMIVIDELPSDVTGNSTGDTNKLLAWIPEIDRETGEEELIKAEFLIYTAPDKAEDGSLLNYGEWDMNVLMDASASGVDTIPAEGPDGFFAASARIGTDGSSVLRVHDRFSEDMEVPDQSGGFTTVDLSEEMKGILYRDGSTGYGMVSYPNWDSCWQWDGSGTPPCATGVPTNVAKYAYNGNYLGVQEVNNNVADDAVYKDRNLDGAIRVVHRYALFHADADAEAGIAEGDDAEKHLSFGFPVSYERAAEGEGGGTFNEFAYYGAWQGRHQLWGPGGIVPLGDSEQEPTTLVRQDVRPGVTPPTYKLKEFNGTFTVRSMVDTSLDDIKNIAVETWLNDNYEMFYFDPDADGSAPADWQYCTGWTDWSTFDPMGTPPTPPTCRSKLDDGQIDFVALHGADGVLGGDDDSELLPQLPVSAGERRHVNINQCNQNGCSDYVYLASDSGGVTWSGAGFYSAVWGQEGLQAENGASALIPADGDQMWVNIGGSIYIAYAGFEGVTNTTTGWVQKTMTEFNEQTWTPTFDDTADIPFTPERGMEYYMHANGQNYVVTRTDADSTAGFQEGDYSAKLELQTAANPANTDSSANTPLSILPTGTAYLAAPWDNDVKYTLVEDPSNQEYLLMVVAHDASGNASFGSPATDDIWGLVAYTDVNGDNNPNDAATYADDVPLDPNGNPLIVDDWGWVDPSQNGGVQPVQFNWEFADEQNPWGKQQFLVTESGSALNYVILSDPISLTQVSLYDNLGHPVKIDPTGADVIVGTDESNWKKVNLQFDGWMHGLPDMYFELQKNNWSIQGLGDKVRRLLEGQAISDSQGTNYFVKPMEMSLFLDVANPNVGQPDISAADAVNLNTVPDYVHHEMGAAPTTNDGEPVEVKYSEGQPLE